MSEPEKKSLSVKAGIAVAYAASASIVLTGLYYVADALGVPNMLYNFGQTIKETTRPKGKLYMVLECEEPSAPPRVEKTPKGWVITTTSNCRHE